jgi:AcrR family transcriptional regulator
MASTRIDRRERMALQTRRDILQTARRLFAERGYAATSVNDIAEEASVAVQTIYTRLGSKRGIVMALLEVIDEEAGVREAAAAIAAATTPADVLRTQNRLTRDLQERCGDIVGALIAAAALEPEVVEAVAEGRRRHRHGAHVTIDRIAELGGLRPDLPVDHAAALLSVATAHDAWYELVHAHKLSWDEAEQTLTDALTRAILKLN